MSRLALNAATALATMLLVVPAFAADYDMGLPEGSDLRSGFNDDWSMSDKDDPLTFELGARYWYSWGRQSFSIGNGSLSESDQTHSAETYFRINDNSSKFYAKGIGGLSMRTSGSYSGADNGDFTDGQIGYAGADIGYSWLGDFKSPLSFGPFLGYMYWRDSPNASSTSLANSYTTATSASQIGFDPQTGATTIPGDSTANNIESNLLRVGVSGQARIGSLIDISGEVAAVPYALMKGKLGSGQGPAYYTNPPGPGATTDTQGRPGYNVADINSSPTDLSGWGYGAMGEAMVGIHPTDNITLRLGGRAWYLQGTADVTFSRAAIGNPTDSDPSSGQNFDTAPTFSNQGYIQRDKPWSLFRYGALAEFTYNF